MTDVFVTHGGMNSVSEALVYGAPMVVLPFVSDQPVNAECVEKLGVGKTLSYKMAHKEGLKSMVFSVLKDDNIRANSLKVQEWIKQSPGNKDGAEFIIDYYKNGIYK